MSRRIWGFTLISFSVAVLLATFAAPLASDRPDGLDRVAKDRGFLAKAEDRPPAWDRAPLPAYGVPGVSSRRVSTGLAGLAGTLAVFGLAVGIGVVLRKPAGWGPR